MELIYLAVVSKQSCPQPERACDPCRYLDSDKARWTDEERAEARHSGPFVFDARRAVQLAQQHGKRRAAMQLLVELEAFEDALALASSYDERLSVVEEVRPAPPRPRHRACTVALCTDTRMHTRAAAFASGAGMWGAERDRQAIWAHGVQVTDPDQRNALWLALIQLEVDAAEGASGDLGNRIAAIDRCIEDRMVRGTLAVEDALRFLPEQETLASYKQVLLKHMEASSQKVRSSSGAWRAAAWGVLASMAPGLSCALLSALRKLPSGTPGSRSARRGLGFEGELGGLCTPHDARVLTHAGAADARGHVQGGAHERQAARPHALGAAPDGGRVERQPLPRLPPPAARAAALQRTSRCATRAQPHLTVHAAPRLLRYHRHRPQG